MNTKNSRYALDTAAVAILALASQACGTLSAGSGWSFLWSWWF